MPRSVPPASPETSDPPWLSEVEARMTEILSIVPPEFHEADDVLFREGDDARHIFVLTQGLARQSTVTPQGSRQIVAFLWPGDVFGLSETGRYVNSAEMVSRGAFHRLPVTELQRVVRADAELARPLMLKAIHAIWTAHQHIVCLGRLNVMQRVADFLLDCAGHSQCFDARTGTLSLPMGRRDIADFLGTSAEALARALTRLQEEGVVQRLQGRDLHIADLRLLHGVRMAEAAGG